MTFFNIFIFENLLIFSFVEGIIRDFVKAKERVEKISKNSNIVINFKSAVERSYNYMLIDSTGVAYKVDLDNKIETFGKIDDRFTWDNIMNNLF